MNVLRLAALAFLVFVSLVPGATAQNITGSTTIDIDPDTGTVSVVCVTDLDGDAMAYYEASVTCTLYGNGTFIKTKSNTDTRGISGAAVAVLATPGVPGTTYTATGTHTGFIQYLADEYSDSFNANAFYDAYNFGFFESPPETFEDTYDWFGPGPPEGSPTNSIETGKTTATATDPKLTCSPTPVTRGNTVTCTASGSGGNFSNWTFTDGTNTVTSANGSTSTTWSGIAVTSGIVTVTVTNSDSSTATASAPLTVNARSGWAFTAQSPTQVMALTLCVDSVPVTPSTENGNTGEACPAPSASYSWANAGSGPNQGYVYLTSATDTGSFTYKVSADIQNSTSTFYQAQCGNYNASTNPNGFISGSTLNIDTIRHEAGPVPGPSHYANYVANLNVAADNVGTQLESAVAAPSQNIDQIAQGRITSASNALLGADMEPCGTHATNLNASCVLDGYVNVAPYATCQ